MRWSTALLSPLPHFMATMMMMMMIGFFPSFSRLPCSDPLSHLPSSGYALVPLSFTLLVFIYFRRNFETAPSFTHDVKYS